MALRKTLEEVLEAVRHEAKLSSNSSRGTDHREHLVHLIKRHYQTLAEEHDWIHLELKRNDAAARKVLQAGSRIYTFPTSVNPQKIDDCWVKYSGVWVRVTYGIGREQYTIYDPADDERTDPVERWAFQDDNEFEVWPIPATNGTADDDGEIAFEGQRAIEQLTEDASRLDMDDILVSLHVAAEVLAGNGQKVAATIKQEAAKDRLHVLRRNLSDKRRTTVGAGMPDRGRWPRHPTHMGIDN